MNENQIHPDDITAYIQDNGLPQSNIDLANMVNFFAELIINQCIELSNEASEDGKLPSDVLTEYFGLEK